MPMNPYAFSLAAAIYKQSHFGKSIDAICLKQIIEETVSPILKGEKEEEKKAILKNLPVFWPSALMLTVNLKY